MTDSNSNTKSVRQQLLEDINATGASSYDDLPESIQMRVERCVLVENIVEGLEAIKKDLSQ